MKQRSLLQRFETISDECEELRERASAAEEDRDKLEEALEQEKEKWNKENQQWSNQKVCNCLFCFYKVVLSFAKKAYLTT